VTFLPFYGLHIQKYDFIGIMENKKPFERIGGPSKEVPEELRITIMKNVKAVIAMSQSLSENNKAMLASFFKTRQK
jgi:hypothetical protein